MGENNEVCSLFHVGKLEPTDKREIMMEIINVLRRRGLSYRQALELLNDTKEQIGNISINFKSQ